MSEEVNMIRDDNISFYQKTELLKNETYLRSLGGLNRFFGLVYIVCSTLFATVVKNKLKTYQFVRQAGYEALGDMEVLEWAKGQADSTFWDLTQIFLFVFMALMFFTVVWVSFIVKKYDLYKRQRRYLIALFSLGATQMICAVVLPCVLPENGLPSVSAALASLAFQTVILLPQLLGSELFFPLEIKNLPMPMRILNSIVEFVLKKWLDEKRV